MSLTGENSVWREIYLYIHKQINMYVKLQSVPRSKHTASLLYKPVS